MRQTLARNPNADIVPITHKAHATTFATCTGTSLAACIRTRHRSPMALKDCHPFSRTLLCMLAAETAAKLAAETALKELVEDD